MLTTEKIIEFFDMKPLPDEGGFFVETYRAEGKITQTALPPRYSADRGKLLAEYPDRRNLIIRLT
jgi:predicted cupin superfamily sugar epimerase